jgi:hypothetical protein
MTVRDRHDQLQPRDGLDRLRHRWIGCYFEPLTFEDVSAIIAREQSTGGDVAVVVSTAARRR